MFYYLIVQILLTKKKENGTNGRSCFKTNKTKIQKS